MRGVFLANVLIFLPFRYLLNATGLSLLSRCRTTGTDDAAELSPAPDVPPSDGVSLVRTSRRSPKPPA